MVAQPASMGLPHRSSGHNLTQATRIRRVKCDEATPCCRRCTETGRKCDGPAVGQILFIHDHQSRKRSAATPRAPQLEISLFAPQHSEDARRAFHYFSHHAIHFIAVPFDARFWKDLVLQLAHNFTFVWNSVVSNSILMEHVPYTSLSASWDSTTSLTKVVNGDHRRALRYYNQAIANVRQLAELGQMDDSLVVLSYMLFASVEFGQRNVKTATDLMKRCCEILTANLTTLPHAEQNLNATAQAVHQVVTPFVLRKAVLTATLGNGPSPSDWIAEDKGSSKVVEAVLSRSPWLKKARLQLHSLIFESYEIIRVAEFVVDIKSDNDLGKLLFSSTRRSLLGKLMRWKASFTAVTTQSTRNPDVGIQWIMSYFSMYWAVCYIYLVTCASHRQTIFDDYMDHFVEILEHARICLRHINAHSFTEIQLLTSSFDPGMVPPLYFCATKCRNPILRREAHYLMRQAVTRTENLRAFVAPDRVVARVISVEEAGGDYLVLPSSSGNSKSPGAQNVYAGLKLPPEERRFAHVTVVSRRAPGGQQRQALEMSRFETTSDGSRRLIHEYTWLDDEEEEIWAHSLS